jgi:hypothetical protein
LSAQIINRYARTGTVLLGLSALIAAVLFCHRSWTVLKMTEAEAGTNETHLTLNPIRSAVAATGEQPACRISGTVFERAGHEPVIGAVVVIAEKGSDRTGALRPTHLAVSVTDAQGLWSTVVAASRTYAISVASLGFSPQKTTIVGLCHATQSQSVEVDLRRGGVVVTGMVIAPTAAPVGDAVVFAQRILRNHPVVLSEEIYAAFAILDTRYWLQLEPGDYVFTAEAPGELGSRSLVRSLGLGRNRVDFVLFPAAFADSGAHDQPDGSGSSDSELRGNDESARASAVSSVGTDAAKDAAAELKSPASISGRVIDAVGEPPQRAWVMVSSAAPSVEDLPRCTRVGSGHTLAAPNDPRPKPAWHETIDNVFRYVPTKADGTFEASGLRQGRYELAVYGPDGKLGWAKSTGHADDPHIVNVHGTEAKTEVDLEVQACLHSISGIVEDTKGVLVPNVLVTAYAEESLQTRAFRSDYQAEHVALTEKNGEFALIDLCGGFYQVRAVDAANRRSANASEVPTGVSVKLQLHSMATLEGVTRYRGVPIADFNLVVSGPVQRRMKVHAPDGRFQVADVDPGDYEALVESAEGYAFGSIRLKPGGEEQLDLTLFPWTSLKGRIVRGNGDPVAGAQVQLHCVPLAGRPAQDPWPSASMRARYTTTNADGGFNLEHLTGRRGRISFLGSDGPYLVKHARLASSIGTVTGPNAWLELEPWADQQRDLGTIEVTTGELP